MASKRIFISFAIEDSQYRDLLKGQALNTDSPFTYTDMSAMSVKPVLVDPSRKGREKQAC